MEDKIYYTLDGKPEDCRDCPFYNEADHGCNALGQRFENGYSREDDCPIKPVSSLYPYLHVYDNGIFTEYNVVYERTGIVSTCCFGRNKEMAEQYLENIKNKKVL